MSYEGYDMVLCENGHLFYFDCYDPQSPVGNDDTWKCPHCKTPASWWNAVNETDCCSCAGVLSRDEYDPDMCQLGLSWDEIQSECQFHGIGHIALEIAAPTKECTCKECGNKHIVELPRYKIPADRGHLLGTNAFIHKDYYNDTEEEEEEESES